MNRPDGNPANDDRVQTPTVSDFTNFVRDLVVSGWIRLPVSPATAGFLATHPWPDGTADTVVVFDLDKTHARREGPDGAPVWLFDGDLNSVRLALARLPCPDSPGAPNTPLARPPSEWEP